MSSYNIKLKANPNHNRIEDDFDNLEINDKEEINDEEDDEEVQAEKEEDVETEEEIIDDEYRIQMHQAFLKSLERKEDNSLVFEEKVKKVKNKVKKTNVMSLKDFMTEDEKNKTKKFVSRRAEDRKKKLGFGEIEVKRQFQPRLKPYNLVFSNNEVTKKVDLNDKDEFPSL